ncbi:MAG: hypothetical protein AAGA01_11740, partial [Cyanobacteria bacterium P01_E01_bin.43]
GGWYDQADQFCSAFELVGAERAAVRREPEALWLSRLTGVSDRLTQLWSRPNHGLICEANVALKRQIGQLSL